MGVHCDRRAHFSADLSLWLDSPCECIIADSSRFDLFSGVTWVKTEKANLQVTIMAQIVTPAHRHLQSYVHRSTNAPAVIIRQKLGQSHLLYGSKSLAEAKWA